jgi:hypothetical protein
MLGYQALQERDNPRAQAAVMLHLAVEEGLIRCLFREQ